MALQTTTVKFSERELLRLDHLVVLAGAYSRSEVIRKALGTYEVYRRLAEDFVAEFRARFDTDAYVAVELDDEFDAFMRIDGERQADVYLPTRHVEFSDGSHYVEVYLGDPHPKSSVRIELGLLPLRSGVPMSFALRELDIDMEPRTVAYFVNG
jgi:Arc/MetJ-type ribon-helix-helix transcriptional regulator